MSLIANYKKIQKLYIFSKKINIFFEKNKYLFFLRSDFGIISFKLPSYYFFIRELDLISFIFLNRFFFISFLKHFFLYYDRLSLIYFIRLKIKGLGYRIRKISNELYYFFFNYTNMFYFYIPNNIMIKWYKKRIILLSNDFYNLKNLFSHILLLKKLGPYRLRGLRYPRQIILLKKKKKKYKNMKTIIKYNKKLSKWTIYLNNKVLFNLEIFKNTFKYFSIFLYSYFTLLKILRQLGLKKPIKNNKQYL